MISQGTQKSSVISEISRSSGFGYELEELSDEELVKVVSNLRQQVRLIKLENEILEKTIIRIDPALMHGVYQAYEYATKKHRNSSVTMGSFTSATSPSRLFCESVMSPSKMFSSPSRMISTRKTGSSVKGGSVIYGLGPKINLNEMMEIVSTETNIVKRNLNRDKDRATKKHALLRAELEEIELRVTDIQNASIQFDEEVLTEGFDKITQRISAETWIRFLSDFDKKADKKISKLRLRTCTLNIQFNKLKSQLKFKAELKEFLRPVDFEKLKIENGECLILLDQKLEQINQLKAMTGDANLNLVIHKKTLLTLNQYLNAVLRATKIKKRQIEELDNERDLIKIEADILTQEINKIKKIRATYQVPDVIDYVNIKATLVDLKRAIKMLEHKNRITNLSLISTNTKLKVIMDKTGKIRKSSS